MNILISATQQWNPGDEFIRMGVQNLLRSVIPGEHNYILWNRNPDLFVKWPSDCRLQNDTLSNSFSEPNLDVIDLVVLAGSPEWIGPPLEKIYQALLTREDVPLYVIGVGYSFPGLRLSETERTVLSRESTKIVTRSYEVRDQVNEQLGMEKAVCLPCPALFCGSGNLVPERPLGVIIQGASGRQPISTALRDHLLSWPNAEFITFYKDDFLDLARLGKKPRYHLDSRVLLDWISQYEMIISTRLHGAIAALSCGVPAALASDKENYRITTAQKPFGDFLPIGDKTDNPIVELKSRREIREFKDSVRKQYLDFLKQP